MEVSTKVKQEIIAAIAHHRTLFEGSDARHALSLGLSAAQYSRIRGGDTEQVLSDAKWVSLHRMMEQKGASETDWKAAQTPVFVSILNTLEKCQKKGMSALICDSADIGKTFAAKHYAAHTKNAIYIDCSQFKSKIRLIRAIASEFGVNSTGKYMDIYADLIYYLNFINKPLVILDEAGDLGYEAFLELKALWNATERHTGWVMIGADGLKEKIKRAKDNKKVGFAEIFSRYGSRYQRISPEGKDELKKFHLTQGGLILKANAPKGADIKGLLVKTEGSLRRIYNEVSKLA